MLKCNSRADIRDVHFFEMLIIKNGKIFDDFCPQSHVNNDQTSTVANTGVRK